MRIFVYGTLQRGQRNERLCGEDAPREPASVAGRLFAHPAGYPVLLVPDGLVLARAGADAAGDAATQARARAAPGAPDAGGWPPVEGELVTLADPARQLPALDALEGVVPGRPREDDDYERVLLPVRAAAGLVAAWAWVAAGGRARASWVALAGPRWPPAGT